MNVSMNLVHDYGSLSYSSKPATGKTVDIRDLIKKEDEKKKRYRIELILHTIFIAVFFTAVTLHKSASESFNMNQALVTAFVTQQIDFELQPFSKTFLDVGQPEEFWDWLISVVGGTLDSKTFYNGANKTLEEQNYVMFENRLVGGVRVRLLRVAPNKGCIIPLELKNITQQCYADSYTDATRDTKPFGPPDDPNRYTYQTSSETGSASIYGYMLDGSLDGGGYVVDANIENIMNGGSYTQIFQQLKDDMWIDIAARAVIITMIYVNSEGRVAVMYLFVEIPGDGVLFPHVMIKTFRLDIYVTSLDSFHIFLEVVFVLFVIYLIVSEGREMWKHKRDNPKGLLSYFNNGWNIIELVDIVLYICVIGLYLKYLTERSHYNSPLNTLVYKADMEVLASSALLFYNVCAFNIILTTFRTFKFLKLNRRLDMLWKTLAHAGIELTAFLFIFLIFIFGFIFMGWVAFGADLSSFSTFKNSFASCWNFIIGNVPDYEGLYYSNRALGPAFFVLFTIFVFFILTNVFIAILTNSFDVVKPNTNRAKLSDLLEEKVLQLGRGCRRVFNVITKQQRDIHQLLDSLERPELLEKDSVTRTDVAEAIGPDATPQEIDDLYRWIKKLEAKRQSEAETNEDESNENTTPSSASSPSPASSSSDNNGQTLKDLQTQMAQLQQATKETHQKMLEIQTLMVTLVKQKEHKE